MKGFKFYIGCVLVLAVCWLLVYRQWSKHFSYSFSVNDKESTSLVQNISEPITEHHPDHVTSPGHTSIGGMVAAIATLTVVDVGMMLALYWYRRAYFCRMVRYSRQMAVQLFVLFYVTLMFDPSTDKTYQQQLAQESTNPLKKIKVKTKQAQTDGPLHKRIKERVDKVSRMTAAFRNTAGDQQKRFRRTVSKYQTKEQTMRENDKTISHELNTTKSALQKVKREIVFLLNYMTTISQKIQLYQVDNKHLLGSFNNLHTELRTADETISRIGDGTAL